MSVVRYFAAAREASGLDSEHRAETTLGDLRCAIVAAHPGLAGVITSCAVLVAGRRVSDATSLGNDDVIDVLPPFAGG